MITASLRFLITFTLVLAPLLSPAQQTPRHLLGQRYTQAAVAGALAAHADWQPYPRSPAAWQAAVPAAKLAEIVKAGEAAANYQFEAISATLSLDFLRDGNRTRHSKVSFGKRDALLALVLAESVEGQGRFLEPIVNGLWSICEESYWGVPAHLRATGLPDVADPIVDLFSAETASLLALTDYLIGAQLDGVHPLLRKRIYHETNRRIFTPMMTKSDGYSWMSQTRPVNNWNPWIMSNWIASTLLLEKDPDRRAAMIHGAMLGLDRYLNSLGEDGGCDEGPGYWSAAGGATFDCLDLLAQATGGKVNIYGEPLVRAMGAYIYKAHIAGPYFINFADASPRIDANGLMIYRFGRAIQDPQMVQFGLWWARQNEEKLSLRGNHLPRLLANLLSEGKLPPGPVAYQPLPEAWMPDVQVLTARSAGGLFLGTHGGHNDESHNHNDVGDFVLYVDGQPIIVDVGSGTYTATTFSNKRYDLWYTQSNYHNLPTINGRGQSAGRAFQARAVTSRLTPEVANLTMDLAGAYPKEAAIKRWQRSVTLARQENRLEVVDDYELKAVPSSVQQSFMTVATVEAEQPGKVRFKAGKKVVVTLAYDAAVWAVTVEEPPQTGPDYGSIPGKWGGLKVRRVLFALRQPVVSGQFRYTFTRE